MVEPKSKSESPDVDISSGDRFRRGPSLTRRHLLASTGRIAVLASLPLACVPAANKPWADGTFWDDGLGWSA